ncbi:MAG: replicative DNA helicase [Armatimonadota bacterium]
MIEMKASASRTPPQNIEAEQSTLGSMMLSAAACETAAQILTKDDFYRPAHQTIFDTLLTLIDRGLPVDLITVCEQLDSRGELEKVGGREYIASLIDAVPTAANVEYYARIVEEKAILRRLIDVSAEIHELGFSESEDVTSLVDRAEHMVLQVGRRRLGKEFSDLSRLLHRAWESINHAYQNKGQTSGAPTGFEQLDRMTNGLQKGDLVIIAARPSMGKTALALNISVNCALATKEPVAIFSLEMSSEQLVHRMISSLAKVDGHRMRSGYLRDGDWEKIVQISTKLEAAPILIDDSTDISAMAMRAKCRRLKAERGLGLVMVDYLQLMRWHRIVENRNQEISEIARALKGLARELNVPVIALSQLSRQTERREGNKPMLSDLRESGAIEAEADVVMMIYRPDYYKQREARLADAEEDDDGGLERPEEPEGEVAEIIVAKQRNGPTGTVKLSFIPKYASFENLAYIPEDA